MKLVIEVEQLPSGEWTCRSVRAAVPGTSASPHSAQAQNSSRPGSAAGSGPLATEKQLNFLRKLRQQGKVAPFNAASLTKKQAGSLIADALAKNSNAA